MTSRFTSLESDVLDALAWDLREVAPDLAGQFAEALPGVRRNTGAGLFTEMIVDRSRPPPMTTPTGRFGTVHAMVGDLSDPIAFQVELVSGRLIGLHGDAYGQDTRAIDFARVSYDQIFTVERGESVAFDAAALMQPSPLLDLHQHPDTEPAAPLTEPRLKNVGAMQQVHEPARSDLIELLFGKADPAARAAISEEGAPDQASQTSVLIGLWVLLAVVAFFAVVLFDAPVFLAVFLAAITGQTLRKPKVLAAVTRAARLLGRYEYRRPRP